MRRVKPASRAGRRLLPLAAAALTLGACSPAAAPAPRGAPPPAAPSPTPAPLSLDVALGQVVGVDLVGRTVTPELRHMVVDEHVGTVVLFRGNVGTRAELRTLVDQLLELGREALLPAPLLVTLDEEGGDVDQIADLGVPTPSETQQGRATPEQVRSTYAAMGTALHADGIGMDLAPVSDLRTNPADTAIGTRSFGSDPGTVAPLVAAAVVGLHDGGVAATLKHFPGLGGAPGDPHGAVTVDPETRARWDATQARTVRAGILAGADAVMTTAVRTPALTGSREMALFDPAVVNGLLRQTLGFDGVVVTDSLSLGGIGRERQLPVAAVDALRAGNDLLLLGADDPRVSEAGIAALRGAVEQGLIPADQVRASAARVLALRRRWQPPGSAGPTVGGLPTVAPAPSTPRPPRLPRPTVSATPVPSRRP